MMNLFELSELSRSFLSLWALLLCLVCIFGIVLSVSQKRYGFAALPLIPFAAAYCLWQVLFDIHLCSEQSTASFSRHIGPFPWIFWLTALLIITVFSALLLIFIVRYGKRSITPAAIKLCLDRMPCGVCCWRDNGRVLFSNICMNTLCTQITGSPLLNGNLFYDKVKDDIMSIDGKVWRFTCRDITFGGGILHEMIASDITTQYAETQALEKDKLELSGLKSKLQEYSLSIEDTVRRQEILQAKVNIHDEMNRLMLSTMAAEKDDTEELDRILSMWEQNALLLCMQADESADKKAVTRVSDLAKALGICLNWRGDIPPSLNDKQRGLFFTAAQEAVINAAKHAQANNLDISFAEDETSVRCDFINDGDIPSEEVRFAGGLANLALLAGEQGASVDAESKETFTLTLRFKKA